VIKEGAKLIGRSAGNVRPPLVMPNDKESIELKQLIENIKKLK